MSERTLKELRRAEMVTEIETMGTAGQLDNLLFQKDPLPEAEQIVDYIINGLKTEPATIAEYKALFVFGLEKMERAVGKQRTLRGNQ